MLAHFCGMDLKDIEGASPIIKSSNNTLLVVFKSDYTVEYKGFKAMWNAEIPEGFVDMSSKCVIIYRYIKSSQKEI